MADVDLVVLMGETVPSESDTLVVGSKEQILYSALFTVCALAYQCYIQTFFQKRIISKERFSRFLMEFELFDEKSNCYIVDNSNF